MFVFLAKKILVHCECRLPDWEVFGTSKRNQKCNSHPEKMAQKWKPLRKRQISFQL